MASVYTMTFSGKKRENLLAPEIASMKATTCSVHSSLDVYLAQVIYVSKKLSHHFLLHFPIGMGSNDHHVKYQGVFQELL